jgi:hypothetical protein
VDWGAAELRDKACQIVVEKNWDENEEVYRNLVVNVLPIANDKSSSGDKAEFDDIPF